MIEVQHVKNEIKINGFASIYYYEHGKEFQHPPEQHDSWEIVYVDRGRIIAVTDGVGSILEEGMAIFHEPNDVHAHISDREVSNNMFVVTFTTDSPAMEFFKKKTFELDEDSKKLLSLFLSEAKNALGEIQGDYNHRHKLVLDDSAMFGSTQLMAAYLEEFLIKLIRNSHGNTISQNAESRQIAKNSTVGLISDFMRKNIYNELTLPELCEHFFIGKSQLTFIFKECTGKSPMQFFASLKIEEAKKLLRESPLTVGEIAEALAFSGIHSFSRAFKTATGFSPVAYKQSIF